MKLLVVEDEEEMAKSIKQYLDAENYLCEVAYSAREGEDKIAAHEYDCILLDITLGNDSGFRLLEFLKKQKREEGVIIISAKDSLDDKIKGLNVGADDYIAKPFHLAELGARISAVIRRKKFEGSNEITINEITVDLLGKKVLVKKKEVDLTRKEYDLLLFMVSNRGRVVTKNAIAEHLSGDDAEVFDNFDFIYTHMKNLKKKLSEAGSADYIRTVYGLGYKFEV